MSSFLSDLKEFRDILQAYAGSGSVPKQENIFSSLLSHCDSVIHIVTDEDGTKATNGEMSTDWALLLKDCLDYLESHQTLLQSAQSEAYKIAEDIRLLLEIAHEKVTNRGIDDKWNLANGAYNSATYSVRRGSSTSDTNKGAYTPSTTYLAFLSFLPKKQTSTVLLKTASTSIINARLGRDAAASEC
ncbi:hypothetical protein BJX68DRAFT_265884 [Aspergillus pseudodeflectus]|uniref:Uncharacterized protein n=1 Tax=Aspergillus pseudodeflectus TaxID=176178 RepID=A0ABR4KK86_9EURO